MRNQLLRVNLMALPPLSAQRVPGEAQASGAAFNDRFGAGSEISDLRGSIWLWRFPARIVATPGLERPLLDHIHA